MDEVLVWSSTIKRPKKKNTLKLSLDMQLFLADVFQSADHGEDQSLASIPMEQITSHEIYASGRVVCQASSSEGIFLTTYQH